MAITSKGYDGSVSDTEMAQIMQHSGSLVPVVCGYSDFAVSINSSANLTCTVAAGGAEAPGVKVISDATASATFDAVTTAGQTRWDAVVLRYNWAAGTTTLVVVKGIAAASAPAVLPGGVDLVMDSALDQVLALVQLTYGSNIPTQVLDRRMQATKEFTAPSTAAFPAASALVYGMAIRLPSGELYKCLRVASSYAWVQQGGWTEVTANSISGASGFTAGAPMVSRYLVDPTETHVQYDIQLRLTTASFRFDANGMLPDKVVATMSGPKPDGPWAIPVEFIALGGVASNTADALPVQGRADSQGRIIISSSLPNMWIGQRLSADNISLQATISFSKKGA